VRGGRDVRGYFGGPVGGLRGSGVAFRVSAGAFLGFREMAEERPVEQHTATGHWQEVGMHR